MLSSTLLQVLAASLVTVGIFLMALPLLMTGYISLFSDGVVVFPPSSYTLAWYGRIFEFPRLAESLGTSLRIAVTATLFSIALGVPASIALVRLQFVGRTLLGVLLLSPLTVPGVVLGLGLYVAIVEFEIRTQVAAVGSNIVLIVAHMLITIPWTIRLCVASLAGLDSSIEDAAAIHGARPVRVLWEVTLPLIRQGIVAAGLFSFVVSFENIEMTLFLVSPGQTTFPISVLQYLEYRADPLVAAVAVVQTSVIAALLLLVNRYAKLAKVV